MGLPNFPERVQLVGMSLHRPYRDAVLDGMADHDEVIDRTNQPDVDSSSPERFRIVPIDYWTAACDRVW